MLAAVGIASASFGQGYVTWNASPGQFVIGQTNSTQYSGLSASLGGGASTGGGVVGNTVAGGSSLYYYALLVSTTASTSPTSLTSLASDWTSSGLMMTNGPAANGRLNPMNPITAGAVPWSGSGAEQFMFVGWSANLGNNYSTVLTELQNWSTQGSGIVGTAFFGVSSVGSTTPSSSSSVGVTLWGAAGSGLISNTSTSPMQLFALQVAPVPEPGTIALAALGGASMLLFRRRNK